MYDSSIDFDDYLDDPNYDLPTRRMKPKKNKPNHAQVIATLSEAGDDSRRGFNPSYLGSKHERQWIMNYLGPFFEDNVITDVLRQVKGGKEATVYCCKANPTLGVELIAAKVYRPRMFRQLRNDAVYRKGRETIGEEGKEVRGRRYKLAMQKKTDFGQVLRHTTWLANEFETLRRLHAAGADVPKPFLASDNVILMEYLGAERSPAPPLSQVRLSPPAARALFERLLHDVELMLEHDRVHADLSAYNVLYWNDRATIIDFPQAIDPYVNPEAFALLARDVERLCQYFARYGIDADDRRITRDLWERVVLHQAGTGGVR